MCGILIVIRKRYSNMMVMYIHLYLLRSMYHDCMTQINLIVNKVNLLPPSGSVVVNMVWTSQYSTYLPQSCFLSFRDHSLYIAIIIITNFIIVQDFHKIWTFYAYLVIYLSSLPNRIHDMHVHTTGQL